MIGSTNLLIACLFFLASVVGIQAVGNITVEASRFELLSTVQATFHYYSAVVKAASVPTVYGCSYLSTNATSDAEFCRREINSGSLQALPVRNASDDSLRQQYPPNYPRPPTENGTYWYIHEVSTSCWRNQELYGTTDGQNFAQLWNWTYPESMRWAPILNKAELNVTTKCMSVEFEAIENGTCADVEYQVGVTQTWSLQSDSCDSCSSQTGCCYEQPWLGAYFKVNGTGSSPLINHQYCFEEASNTNLNFIGMLNDTHNDTSRWPQFGLFRIKKNSISVRVQAVIGKRSGLTSNPRAIELETPTTGSGNILGSGNIIHIISFVMVLVLGYVW